MERKGMRRIKRSNSAMFLLLAEGCCFLVISAVVLACGFVLNFDSNFDADKMDSEFDYPQYWVGIVFLITSFVAITAGGRQRSSCMIVTALIFFLLCILVSLFALVVEGNDWNRYKDAIRRKDFWESENYDCESKLSSTCVCNDKTNDEQWISHDYSCTTLKKLNYTYGAIICCALAGIFFALTSIVVVLLFIPMKHFSIPEPKTKIQRITVLEEKEEEPETRIVMRQKPAEPEIEDIVIRERQPRRQRTIVYDQPIPQPRPQRVLVPLEAPPAEREVSVRNPDEGDTRHMISHIYDEGRLVARPEVRPPRDPSPVSDRRQYVINPNFAKSAAPRAHRYAEGPEPAPEFVGRERPVYATKAVVRRRDLAYSEDPRVHAERRHVPAGSKYRAHREERPLVYTSRYSIQGRPRANSDEGRGRMAEERHRVYSGEGQRVVQYGRPRAYSDERPRVFAGGNTAPAIDQQRYPNPYDQKLENSLQTADTWAQRPPTPY